MNVSSLRIDPLGGCAVWGYAAGERYRLQYRIRGPAVSPNKLNGRPVAM